MRPLQQLTLTGNLRFRKLLRFILGIGLLFVARILIINITMFLFPSHDVVLDNLTLIEAEAYTLFPICIPSNINYNNQLWERDLSYSAFWGDPNDAELIAVYSDVDGGQIMIELTMRSDPSVDPRVVEIPDSVANGYHERLWQWKISTNNSNIAERFRKLWSSPNMVTRTQDINDTRYWIFSTSNNNYTNANLIIWNYNNVKYSLYSILPIDSALIFAQSLSTECSESYEYLLDM